MRTFLRLEFLYRQLLANIDREAPWASRAATVNLIEIIAILTRGDVRSDAHKELDQQIETLRQYASQPEVDKKRLESIINNLTASRQEVMTAGTSFLQPLKDCEFLNAIKHRSAIPGGTCEFDLPEFNHWLRKPYAMRQRDLFSWLAMVRPVCDAVVELLWLIRESAQPTSLVAENGMYQHRMSKDASCRLIRVSLPANSPFFPEISGSQRRFTVRFLEWRSIDRRALQTNLDVPFSISIC